MKSENPEMDTTCNPVWRSGLIGNVTQCWGLFETKTVNLSLFHECSMRKPLYSVTKCERTW